LGSGDQPAVDRQDSTVSAEPQPPLDANLFVLDANRGVVGELQVTVARAEDTFVEFARTYGLGFDELEAANPDVDPWLPGAGTKIVLPTRFLLPRAPREGIVLNVATKRLFYFPPAVPGVPAIVQTYPIGIGRTGWSTPTGETSVTGKARDPVWYVPASVREEHAAMDDPLPAQVPPGPDNPLGNRVMQLGLPGYLIHGTNKPAGVGMRVSHGCVRLFPEDIEYLFDQVPTGTAVRIVNQPVLLARDDTDLLLEVHPPLEENADTWLDDLPPRLQRARASLGDSQAAIDSSRVDEIIAQARGFPVSILAGGSDADAQLRRARRAQNVIVHQELAEVADQ
jgi:L,D-transpeptidase ErfK/SrfK